jgi:hypothetical protein
MRQKALIFENRSGSQKINAFCRMAAINQTASDIGD